ncbi:glycosyltransferase family 2 protein [Gilvimarinus sp. SDUM040013]|uniref:Glycosyltransferase family 2 protein n=1 Tax=Gilvimarinus gilvus TaxID=3058038 RepID=A0ABU4S042_9GAMM|nr:glycosyltransferase family 2 protein [Gilvimarinus sp. SDUM040013]MDO3385235.1 glycosyltransferase family 2 protein [Gilvimarinus sp. SDUM040013]MDX6849218.1 glycosyltransferase family 2 protein [Gilvimarinus sp. SDUM040013]
MPVDSTTLPMALVSIIMPAYNAGATIANAIESVVRQNFMDWQLVVVDDASADNTAEIINKYVSADSRISYIRLNENSGSPAIARNKGLEYARGEYIAFLDADDVWLTQKLQRQLQFIDERELDLCAAGVDLINAAGQVVGLRQPKTAVDYKSLLASNPLICSTVLCQAKHLQHHKFPVVGHEDYALWLVLSRAGVRMAVQQERLAQYRKHPGSVSANKLRVISYFWRIYSKEQGFSVPMSMYLTARYLILAVWRARKELIGKLKI